jgi:hypothetical protein
VTDFEQDHSLAGLEIARECHRIMTGIGPDHLVEPEDHHLVIGIEHYYRLVARQIRIDLKVLCGDLVDLETVSKVGESYHHTMVSTI